MREQERGEGGVVRGSEGGVVREGVWLITLPYYSYLLHSCSRETNILPGQNITNPRVCNLEVHNLCNRT